MRFCEGVLGWILECIADAGVLVSAVFGLEKGTGSVGDARDWIDDAEPECDVARTVELCEGELTEREAGSSEVVTGDCGGGEGDIAANRGGLNGKWKI